MLRFDVLLRDRAEEASGALHLETIGKEPHLNVRTRDAVVAMGGGVDQCLAVSPVGVLRDFATDQSLEESAPSKARKDHPSSLLHHLRDRAAYPRVVEI